MFSKLEAKIVAAYQEGITVDDAEKLAAEFLAAQMTVSSALRQADLDARMRKSGNKAIRASVLLNIIKNNDKKPTESVISAMIDSDSVVAEQQNALDEAEVDRDELKRYFDIFHEAHVYFRGIAKGNFNG